MSPPITASSAPYQLDRVFLAAFNKRNLYFELIQSAIASFCCCTISEIQQTKKGRKTCQQGIAEVLLVRANRFRNEGLFASLRAFLSSLLLDHITRIEYGHSRHLLHLMILIDARMFEGHKDRLDTVFCVDGPGDLFGCE